MRLSHTNEIQSAFRREMAALFQEAGTEPEILAGMIPEGTLDGAGLLNAYDSLSPNTFADLGMKPEQVRVLKSLTVLLSQCARVEATPVNLQIVLPLFHPAKPTTPVVADAMEEVILAFIKSIEPKKRSWFQRLTGDKA